MGCFRGLLPLCAPLGGSDSPDFLPDFISRGAPCSSPPVFSAGSSGMGLVLWLAVCWQIEAAHPESFPSGPMTGQTLWPPFPAWPGPA